MAANPVARDESRLRVCLMRDFGSLCEAYDFDCNLNRLSRTEGHWKKHYERRAGQEKLVRTDSDVIRVGQYGSFSQRGTTYGLLTCSAVALINTSCNRATLAHFVTQDPNLIPLQVASEFLNDIRSVVCGIHQRFPKAEIQILLNHKGSSRVVIEKAQEGYLVVTTKRNLGDSFVKTRSILYQNR